jgi:hypothetical protein
VLGPFQVEKRPLTLHPKDAKPDAGSGRAGPVGWWKLDETGGSTAANAAGNKLTGKLHGKSRWAPDAGARGGALEFDSRRDWVEFADTSDLDFRGGLSVAVWIKTHAEAKPGGTLLAKGEAWRLQRAGGKGHLEFALTGPQVNKKGKSPSVAFKQPMKDNEWHHVVGVYDGKRIALYVDGEEKDVGTASGPISVNNVPVTLGENAASRGQLFDGWLDDARLYTRGLSAEEVKTLFREGAK